MVKKYTQHKYFSTSERNTPEYKLWRLAVFTRDKFKCKKCGAKIRKGRNLQAHHIRPWATYPSLRYNVNNGITLCWNCHKILFSNEEGYIPMCVNLIGNQDIIMKVNRMMHEERKADEQISPQNSEEGGESG